MFHPDTPEEYRNQIVTGDARILAERIPDESVDLVFSDPVYWQMEDYEWLSKTASRVLKPNGSLLVYFGMYHLPATMAALAKHLTFRWLMAEKKIGTSTRIWTYKMFSHWKPYLFYTKQEWQPQSWLKDFVFSKPDGLSVNHAWGKNIPALIEIIASHSRAADIVLDPFCGGASIPAVCKMLGRNFIASEIDPQTAERARLRLEQTQVPLFVLEPEQAVLGI